MLLKLASSQKGSSTITGLSVLASIVVRMTTGRQLPVQQHREVEAAAGRGTSALRERRGEAALLDKGFGVCD